MSDAFRETLIEAAVEAGWMRAQYQGKDSNGFPEITDAYRHEVQIKAALRIGADAVLDILEK